MALRVSKGIYLVIIALHMLYFLLHGFWVYPVVSRIQENTVLLSRDETVKDIVSVDSSSVVYVGDSVSFDYVSVLNGDLAWCNMGQGEFRYSGVGFSGLTGDIDDLIDESLVGTYIEGDLLWFLRVRDGVLYLERGGVESVFSDDSAVLSVDGDFVVLRGLRRVPIDDTDRIFVLGEKGVRGYSESGGVVVEGFGSLLPVVFGDTYLLVALSYMLCGLVLWLKGMGMRLWGIGFVFEVILLFVMLIGGI